MNNKHWTPQERAEYSELLDTVSGSATTSTERTAKMSALVDDAIQAHRAWAREVRPNAIHRGHLSQWKGWAKRPKVLFVSEGAKKCKPRVVGTVRKVDGKKWDHQVLIETLTFDEIKTKRGEDLRQAKAYTDSVALDDRLLALRDMAGSEWSETPTSALKRLGLTLDEYLGTEAA